jgi:2,4-dienoyl-CoA reductase-like NADH-dependent reductase (Old Yellow Enzyme family)/thioredoxin reductase
MSDFVKLFEPIRIGSVEVPNRIYMPSMCTNYAGPNGESTLQDIGYYEARAKGGAGLICIDFSCVSPEGRALMGQRGLWQDEFMPHFTRIVDVIGTRGARVATQLHHAGVNAEVSLPKGPSRLGNQHFFVSKPEELTTEEVEEIVDKFAAAAWRAKTCGVDMVEIHGSHGYLVSQFISPIYNRRSDRYGRDRALFAIDIVKKIKNRCGTDFPIIFRFNADEYAPDGITPEYALKVAQRLEEAGVDMLNVTGCNYDTLDYTVPNMYIEDEESEYYRFVGLAAEIRKLVDIPVMSGGLISNPALAEKILRDGIVDMVFVGRQLIADPDWPNKVRLGRLEDIRPCCACMDGCIGRIFHQGTVWCTVNPLTGFEYRWSNEDALPKASPSKRVLVVGTGPAGLESARIAAYRGHQVTLIDQSDKIGGTVNTASVPNFKRRQRQLMKWYEVQLGKLGVEIRLNSPLSVELVSETAAEVVIISTGSAPLTPSIPGIDKAVLADDLLLGKCDVGQRVAIIGGGFVGLDTALHLGKQGKAVTILEALCEVGAGLEALSSMTFFRPGGLIEKYGICLMPSCTVIEVNDEGVIIVDKYGKRRLVGADTVVCAVGRKSIRSEVNVPPGITVHVIGDARSPRKIIDAIHEGFMIALDI